MKIIKLVCITVLVLGICYPLLAQETAKRVASIAEISGTVEVKTPKEKWKPAEVGMVLNEGDIIRVKADSYALLNVDGKAETATVEVKANSQLRLAELIENKTDESQTTLLDLALGEVLIKAKKIHTEKSKFEVKTPTSVVAVRGTTFSVTVEAVQ